MGAVTRSVWQGLVAGAAGVAVMTPAEKAEQRLTHRPGSYAPAYVLQRLAGRRDVEPRRSDALNWTMHTGQAMLVGVLRGAMANAGLRGPWASAMFTVVRLTSDQLLENATGVGGPGPGQRHAAVAPGRRSHVGPVPAGQR
ncbi:hypothetical protein ACWEOZ_09160 [Actinoplanes sp. NPDC004185]